MDQKLLRDKESPKIISGAGEIAIGFFGWWIASNIIFLCPAGTIVAERGNVIVIGPLIVTVIASVFLFIMKRIWIVAGILSAVFLNLLLWLVLWFLFTASWDMMIELLGIPLPLGILLVFQQ